MVEKGFYSVCDEQLERYFFFFLSFFGAASKAYGVFQARGQIEAVAAGLSHSHHKAGSEPRM